MTTSTIASQHHFNTSSAEPASQQLSRHLRGSQRSTKVTPASENSLLRQASIQSDSSGASRTELKPLFSTSEPISTRQLRDPELTYDQTISLNEMLVRDCNDPFKFEDIADCLRGPSEPPERLTLKPGECKTVCIFDGDFHGSKALTPIFNQGEQSEPLSWMQAVPFYGSRDINNPLAVYNLKINTPEKTDSFNDRSYFLINYPNSEYSILDNLYFQPNQPEGLSGGAIAGIAVGSVVVTTLLMTAVCRDMRNPRTTEPRCSMNNVFLGNIDECRISCFNNTRILTVMFASMMIVGIPLITNNPNPADGLDDASESMSNARAAGFALALLGSGGLLLNTLRPLRQLNCFQSHDEISVRASINQMRTPGMDLEEVRSMRRTERERRMEGRQREAEQQRNGQRNQRR